jgi:hypothetical protein
MAKTFTHGKGSVVLKDVNTTDGSENMIEHYNGNGDLVKWTDSMGRTHEIRHVHGYFACEDKSELITMGAVNTWQQITNATTDLFADIQTNAGITKINDTFKVTATAVTGTYMHMEIAYKLVGHGAVNVDWDVEIYNLTQSYSVPIKSQGTTTGANNRTAMNGIAYDMTANFGDVYIIRLQNTTNGTDFTVTNAAVWFKLSHLVKS